LKDLDFIIVGGGLAGCLLALRLSQLKSKPRWILLEQSGTLGGNHTWSFHASDIGQSMEWVRPLVRTTWKRHVVQFPELRRELHSEYCSVRSSDMHRTVIQTLGTSRIRFNTTVHSVTDQSVAMASGETLSAKSVLDARGIAFGEAGLCGYQKFVGIDFELESPHGLSAPVLMDACVPQEDGFRFFYLLPWSETRVLVEDTRYSDSAHVDVQAYRREIENYVARRGWKVKSIAHEEVGSLPIPFVKDLPWVRPGSLGMRSGLFHPTTGYSFPDAVRSAEWIAGNFDRGTWDQKAWNRACEHTASQRAFYRFLNRALFKGTVPELRYRFIQRFYRLPNALVRKFYASQLSALDCLLVMLWGKPPLALTKAFSLLLEPKGKPCLN
jgi:lycopene beta-cyclase